jgi:hypothetical protein
VLLTRQAVRFYSHTICPDQPTIPETPLLLAEGGFRVFFFNTGELAAAAVGKWESRFGGISKERWGRWETAVRFSTVSTAPSFPQLPAFALFASRGWPSAV